MKKLAIFALLLALVLALPVVAGAQEPMADSDDIEPAILEQIALRDSERVVKIYYVDMYGFLLYDSLEDVIAQCSREQPVYAVLSGSTVLSCFQMNDSGELIQLEPGNSGTYAFSAASVEEYVNHGGLNRLGDGVEVTASYLLYGGFGYGTAIYYETNRGVFVYFHAPGPFGRYSNEYLMSLEEFVWVQQKDIIYRDFHKKNVTSGAWDAAYMANYENFNIHAENFTMRHYPDAYAVWMWVIAFAVGAPVALTSHLIKRRRSLCQYRGPRQLPSGIPQYSYFGPLV